MATNSIISNERADFQISQTSEELDCLEENIIIAPHSLALLGQIMLLSTQRDFSFFSIFRNYFTITESLRAAFVQVSNAGYHAFLTAHTNMDKIRIACDNAQKQVELITECIIEGENSVIATMVPVSLQSMRETAQECAEWSKEICSKFHHTLNLLKEVHCLCHAKKLRKEDTKRFLKDGIEKVAELEAHWKWLVQFFTKISNVSEVTMRNAFEDFANAAECQNLQEKVAEESSNSLKTSTKKKLIQFGFNAYSCFNGVNTVSKSYLKISEKHLMPYIVQPGPLVALDAERRLEIISSMTKEIQSRNQMMIDFAKQVVICAKFTNKNEVKKKLLNLISVDLHQCNTNLTMASKSIISNEITDSQICQTSQNLNFLEGNIIVAPHSLALLGQIMLLSTQRDFSFGRREDFKYITHPESFRATLVQVSNAGYHAFLATHTNMDKIRLACANTQEHVDLITECVTEGEDSDIITMVPVSLKSLRKTTQECAEWSRAICSKFHDTLNLLEEVHCSFHAAQMTNHEKLEELERQKMVLAFEKKEAEKEKQDKQKKIENMKLNIEDRNTTMKKMEALSNKISEAFIKLNTADVKILDIEGIKKLLKDGTEKVADLELHWKQLVRFFGKTSSVTEVEMGKAIEDFANAAESANLQGKVAEGSSNYLKTFIKKKLIRLAFNEYSRCNGVYIVSKSYLKISDTYLMPSIIQLGTLVAIDAEKEPEKICSKTKEIQSRSQMTIEFVKQIVICGKLENENEVKMKAIEYK